MQGLVHGAQLYSRGHNILTRVETWAVLWPKIEKVESDLQDLVALKGVKNLRPRLWASCRRRRRPSGCASLCFLAPSWQVLHMPVEEPYLPSFRHP